MINVEGSVIVHFNVVLSADGKHFPEDVTPAFSLSEERKGDKRNVSKLKVQTHTLLLLRVSHPEDLDHSILGEDSVKQLWSVLYCFILFVPVFSSGSTFQDHKESFILKAGENNSNESGSSFYKKKAGTYRLVSDLANSNTNPAYKVTFSYWSKYGTSFAGYFIVM
jgi:hypothetical protein